MSRATSVGGGLLAAALLLSVATPAAAQSVDTPMPDELAVVVVGDGEMGWSNQAGPVTIQHVDSTGALGGAVAIPVEGSGDQHGFTLGIDRDQAGALQQSTDHRVVTLGGYDAELGAATNGSEAPDTLRVIARVDAEGAVDTSTTLAGSFSERHVRGVATIDGSRYWAAGHGGDSANPLRAGVVTAEHGSDTPTAIVTGGSQERNSRVPVIHDGELYVSSDRDDYNGINLVGAGIPTGAADQTLIAEAPAGREVAHDFAFVGDHLYVAYTEGAPAIVRYGQVEGAWVAEDAFPGQFWGLTGREAGEDTVLYGTRGANEQNELVAIIDTPDADGAEFAEATSEVLAVADPQTSFRGVAFAPGFVPGDGPVVIDVTPAVGWDVRVAGGVGNALSAVLGADSNPVATGTISDPGTEENFSPEAYDITVESGDQGIVADENVELEIEADGRFTLTADPSAAGQTTLTVTVTAVADGRTTTSRLGYWVSDALADETALAHVGMADASASYDVGEGHFLVADDDSNQIRLYGPNYGEAVAEFDFTAEIGADHPTDNTFDLEGAARIDDTIYWVGSLGNTRSGNVRPQRDVVLATEVRGAGAETTLEYVGVANGIRDALVEWDATNAHGEGAGYFQFERATEDGYSAEGPNSLNLEGATIAPDGETLWLGFRSPLVPVAADLDTDPGGDQALIIAIDNIAGVVSADGGAEAIQVSDFFTLDLDGRAIRDLTETEDGNYLISAGSADDSGNFAIYGWTGEIDEAPVESATELGLEGWSGSYESITGATALADGVVVRVLQDAGTVDIYGTGTEAQDLTREFMKFPSHEYVLDFDGAFEDEVAQPEITLSRSEVAQGGTFEVIGSGFPADEEVEFVLHSDPLELGSTVTTGAGALAVTLTVPAGAPVGAHTLTASTTSGVVVSVPLAVLAGQGGGAGDAGAGAGGAGAGAAGAGGSGADAAGAGGSGSLASTGGNDLAAIGIAAVALLVLGGTLLVLRRRFRAEDAPEV